MKGMSTGYYGGRRKESVHLDSGNGAPVCCSGADASAYFVTTNPKAVSCSQCRSTLPPRDPGIVCILTAPAPKSGKKRRRRRGEGGAAAGSDRPRDGKARSTGPRLRPHPDGATGRCDRCGFTTARCPCPVVLRSPAPGGPSDSSRLEST